MNKLKFKTWSEIFDFSQYTWINYVNLTAFFLGVLSILLGNLYMLPFVIVVGLELSLAKYLMDTKTLENFDLIRIVIIIITGVLSFII